MNEFWIQFYLVLYLLGFAITLKSVLKFTVSNLGLLNLKRQMNLSVEVNDQVTLDEAEKLALKLSIQKPIQLRLVPSARSQNLVVYERKQDIYILFLSAVVRKGLIGGLAHELSHVALGHTSVKNKLWVQYILPLLGFLALLVVFIHDEVSLREIKLMSRYALLIVFFSFWIFELPLSRKREAQADKLAAETVGKEEVINFLSNFGTMGTTNFWYELPFGSHPPINKRISLLNNLEIAKPTNES